MKGSNYPQLLILNCGFNLRMPLIYFITLFNLPQISVCGFFPFVVRNNTAVYKSHGTRELMNSRSDGKYSLARGEWSHSLLPHSKQVIDHRRRRLPSHFLGEFIEHHFHMLELSGNLSKPRMSGIEHQNWVLGSSGSLYKITREMPTNNICNYLL